MARASLLALAFLAACGGASKIGSIGAVLGRDNDSHLLYVREVPPDLAADRAGLVPGDQILMIDGVYVRDLDEKTIRAKLRGEIGTTVALTIVRGAQVLHTRVTRGELKPHEVQPKETKIAE